jgi:hypothetical protein
MRQTPSISPKEVRARSCVVRTAIGQMLSAQYDLAEPLPDRLQNLVKRLEDSNSTRANALTAAKMFESDRRNMSALETNDR